MYHSVSELWSHSCLYTSTVEPRFNVLLGIQEKSTLYQGVLYKEVLYSEDVLYYELMFQTLTLLTAYS